MHSKDPSVSTFPFRLYFRYWLLVFALPSTELCVRAVGAVGWLDRRKRKRENCAGRKDALVAAASDSISMNFTAEAAAAVAAAASSDSLSKPEAAPRVVAPTRGPVTASHLPPTLESCVWRGRENGIIFAKGEEQSQVGRSLLKSKDWRIVELDNNHSDAGSELWLWFNPVKVSSWCCSSFHEPYWFILSEKRRGNPAPPHLEIADRFVLLLSNPFFLPVLYYIYSSLVFPLSAAD